MPKSHNNDNNNSNNKVNVCTTADATLPEKKQTTTPNWKKATAMHAVGMTSINHTHTHITAAL